MDPQQPQQPIWDNLAALPEWLTISHHPVPNGGFPAPAVGYQQLPTGFHTGMASNTNVSPQSPSGMLPSQPRMATRGDTQEVPPHAIPHHSAFPAAPRAFAGAPTRRMPYGQQPTATYYPPPPPPPQPRPSVRNILPMLQQGMGHPVVQAPIVPSQALAGVAPSLYHGQMHRAPQGHFAHPTDMQARPHALRVQPMCAPPPGPPPGWQGRAQTRYAPPPGPPPGWTTAPPPPPPPLRPRSVQVRQHPTQLPPSRDQSASPWITNIFTPSLVVSTAATTPALRPSPAVGGPVPLPAVGYVGRSGTQTTRSGQQASHENAHRRVAPAHAIKRSRKRRISDADADASEPGSSTKRPATHTAVQTRSTEINTIGRQVQSHNNYTPSQRAPTIPRREVASTHAAPDPDPTTGHESPEADPIVDESDAGSLFGDEDMDDAALARELALALGQEDVPAVASDDAGALFGDEDSLDNAALAMELALALGEDNAHAASNGDIEPAAAAFALCLPGTDPVPEGGLARSAPAAHLPPIAPAPTTRTPSGGSKREGKKTTRAAPPHPSASNGATASAPPGAPAQPPSAPGNRGKGGARKKVARAAPPSTAAGPSTDRRMPQGPSKEDLEAAAAAARRKSEQRADANKAMLLQNPKLGQRYAWISAGAGPSSAARVHAPSVAAAPTPMVFTRLPPYHGPAGRHPPLEEGRSYPTCQYGPVEKPYWCLICRENREHRTYWHDAMTLREHVRKSHPDLLYTDVWKHEGM